MFVRRCKSDHACVNVHDASFRAIVCEAVTGRELATG
jgi:hypothetical protein